VLSRLHALFLRYATSHADRLRGGALPRVDGRRSGQVEIVSLSDTGIRISGWTSAARLSASWPGGQVTATPSIARADVAKRFGLPLVSGFEVTIPDTAEPIRIRAHWPDGRAGALDIVHPSAPLTPKGRRRLWRLFTRDLLRAVPSLLRFARDRSPAQRERVKSLLGLQTRFPALPLQAAVLAPDIGRVAGQPITILLPVHDAYDALTACLDRVARHTDLPWRMVLVDDASTDPRVRPCLEAWARAQAGRVDLCRLDRNVGFVAAINLALERAAGAPGHVILLNSDAMVPAGWASRLCAPLERSADVASVTPMSNDAELYSVPMPGTAIALPGGVADQLDLVAQGLSAPDPMPAAPTGVGFCMALSRAWLDRVPRFDPGFGRGYGEEVDWCQRTRALGGRHVAAVNLFVEHLGGQSFGQEAKRALVAKANDRLAARYPSFHVDVQTYLQRDPLRTVRLALGIALAAQTARDPLPVFVAHATGGGAEHALTTEIDRLHGAGQSALVLRVGGIARWQIELHGATGVLSATVDSLHWVRRLLAPVPALRIIYSCGVGDLRPLHLPAAMLSLRRPGHPDLLEARVHDFFMISPSYCLLASDGQYRGTVGAFERDAAHLHVTREGREVSLAEWQGNWHRFLRRCHEITVFSGASADLMRATYPDLADRLVLRPHTLPVPIRQVNPPAAGTRRRVAILGNLNRAKGGAVLSALATRLHGRDGPELILFGNLDARFSLPANVRHHGPYKPMEIPRLAERYGVTDWLIPSVWPETFSFTTHEALATGLPVYAFDIGAQGEAMHLAQNGHPIPFAAGADHAAAILSALDAGSGPSVGMTARLCEGSDETQAVRP